MGGVGNGGTGPIGRFCGLFGTTVPFTASRLASLYKDHDAFVAASDRAAQQAVKGGFLRELDAAELHDAAAASNVAK